MSTPSISNAWSGTYIYGSEYPEQMVGTAVHFRAILFELTGNHFEGDAVDLEILHNEGEPSRIAGSIENGFIKFTKTYSRKLVIDEYGTIYIERGKPGHSVQYVGHWDAGRQCFAGEWEIIDDSQVPESVPYIGSGTWEMYPTPNANNSMNKSHQEELTISLNFNQADLEAIYFTGEHETALKNSGVKRSLTFIILTILIVILSAIMAAINYSTGWVMGMVFGTIALLFSIAVFIRHLSAFITWKKKAKKYIQSLVNDKQHTIVMTSVAIEISTPDFILIEKWSRIKNAVIAPSHITLAVEQIITLIPAKSVLPEEYEAIKAFIKKQIK